MATIRGRRKKERELIDFARSYLAEAFPNPERSHCPTDDALRALASRPLAADKFLTSHLSCCSPCFSAYIAHLKAAKPKLAPFFSVQWLAANARPALVLGALAILVMVSYRMLVKPHSSVTVVTPAPVRPPKAAPPAQAVTAYVPVVVDLTSRSAIRGLEPGSQRSQPALLSAKVDLIVRLPLGSEEGMYTVRIRSKSRVLWMKSVPAQREAGQTILDARADLAGLPAGSYDLEVRSGTLDLSVPVLLNSTESH